MLNWYDRDSYRYTEIPVCFYMFYMKFGPYKAVYSKSASHCQALKLFLYFFPKLRQAFLKKNVAFQKLHKWTEVTDWNGESLNWEFDISNKVLYKNECRNTN